jgi:hypothetical protein
MITQHPYQYIPAPVYNKHQRTAVEYKWYTFTFVQLVNQYTGKVQQERNNNGEQNKYTELQYHPPEPETDKKKHLPVQVSKEDTGYAISDKILHLLCLPAQVVAKVIDHLIKHHAAPSQQLATPINQALIFQLKHLLKIRHLPAKTGAPGGRKNCNNNFISALQNTVPVKK